jgi:hypothetical protein
MESDGWNHDIDRRRTDVKWMDVGWVDVDGRQRNDHGIVEQFASVSFAKMVDGNTMESGSAAKRPAFVSFTTMACKRKFFFFFFFFEMEGK